MKVRIPEDDPSAFYATVRPQNVAFRTPSGFVNMGAHHLCTTHRSPRKTRISRTPKARLEFLALKP